MALKINFCKKTLAKLPRIYISFKKIRGRKTPVCVVDSHTYTRSRDNGKRYFEIAGERESYTNELSEAESKWYGAYKCAVPDDIAPHKVVRYIRNATGDQVVLDREFFDSLQNDANPEYPEHKRYLFNGIRYRSVAEKEIAEFYTVNGIPFKYEPEIWIAGMNKPIHPDFVIYIKELGLCKFHEHQGMMTYVNYLRVIKNKYVMYTDAGMIPDIDILFTYDTEDLPFDVRTLWPRLNSMVYCSLLAK